MKIILSDSQKSVCVYRICGVLHGRVFSWRAYAKVTAGRENIMPIVYDFITYAIVLYTYCNIAVLKTKIVFVFVLRVPRHLFGNRCLFWNVCCYLSGKTRERCVRRELRLTFGFRRTTTISLKIHIRKGYVAGNFRNARRARIP